MKSTFLAPDRVGALAGVDDPMAATELVGETTGGEGADVVLECSGHPTGADPALLKDGGVDPGALITDVLPLTHWQQAFDKCRQGTRGKVVFDLEE